MNWFPWRSTTSVITGTQHITPTPESGSSSSNSANVISYPLQVDETNDLTKANMYEIWYYYYENGKSDRKNIGFYHDGNMWFKCFIKDVNDDGTINIQIMNKFNVYREILYNMESSNNKINGINVVWVKEDRIPPTVKKHFNTQYIYNHDNIRRETDLKGAFYEEIWYVYWGNRDESNNNSISVYKIKILDNKTWSAINPDNNEQYDAKTINGWISNKQIQYVMEDIAPDIMKNTNFSGKGFTNIYEPIEYINAQIENNITHKPINGGKYKKHTRKYKRGKKNTQTRQKTHQRNPKTNKRK